jgi:CHASE1-domain containing sensor protein
LTEDLARERFEGRVSEVSMATEDRVGTYEMALRGCQALFTSVGEVSRHQWRDYVGKLNLLQNYPGIQGLGYVKVIPAENIRKHIETVRREGFPEYAIRPPGERPVYTSILYLEPFDVRNQRAFGFDMFSEATRRAAMERSRDTGLTSISARVTLVQETTEGVQAGFLMYLPVYKPGAPIYTGSDRRAALPSPTWALKSTTEGRRPSRTSCSAARTRLWTPLPAAGPCSPPPAN